MSEAPAPPSTVEEEGGLRGQPSLLQRRPSAPRGARAATAARSATMNRHSTSPISAVSRTMAILSGLAEAPEGLGVGELAARLSLSKPIVSRILTTLARDGYLLRDAAQRYRISFKTASLVHRFLDRGGFPAIIQPLLDRLAAASRQLVELWVLEGETLRCIAAARPQSRHQIRSLLGQELPLHASSLGKAWLASLPPERAAAILKRRGLPKLGPNTITSLPALADELERTRIRGYGTALEEMADGFSAVSVVIRGVDREVVGGLSIVSRISEVSPERMHELAALLESAVDDVAAIWPRFALSGRDD